jgi:hypothetical protein
VYPELPPVALAVAVPLVPLKQLTGVDVAAAVSKTGWLTVVFAVAVHPLLSVTVTV